MLASFCKGGVRDFLCRKVTNTGILRYTRVGFFHFLCSVLFPRDESMAEHLPQLQLKTTATEKLTRPYLAKISRQNYIATVITILIVIFSLFWELYKLGGQAKTIYFADSMYGIAAWIGSFWAFRTAYRARFGPLRLEPRHQLAWFVIGIALFANGIGGFSLHLSRVGGTT